MTWWQERTGTAPVRERQRVTIGDMEDFLFLSQSGKTIRKDKSRAESAERTLQERAVKILTRC